MAAAPCTVQAEEAAAAYALESAQLLEQSTSATAARLPKINEFRGKKRRGLLSKAEDTSSSRHGALLLSRGPVPADILAGTLAVQGRGHLFQQTWCDPYFPRGYASWHPS